MQHDIKYLIIRQEQSSNWISCISITDNLERTYSFALRDEPYKIINLNTGLDKFKIMQIARETYTLRPQKIIFIDHAPHPGQYINYLDEIYGEETRPKLIFHLFGDFTLSPIDWRKTESSLYNFSCLFMAASKKQVRLLEKLFQNKDSIKLFPFPVDENTFFYDTKLRESTRNKLGVSQNAKLFFYSGRISDQKNSIETIRLFFKLIKQFHCDFYFIHAGNHDDLSVPYLGKISTNGSYYQSWRKLMSEIEQSGLADRIKYLGGLKQEKLNQLYNASDYIISLSTHNDEDYGMSIAEALLCGCKPILTDWAGYSSFLDDFKDVSSPVPVKTGETKVVPRFNLAMKYVLNKENLSESQDERGKIALKNQKLYSIKYLSGQIQDFTEKTVQFKGFTNLFYKLCSTYSMSPRSPFKAKGGGYSKLYHEVYKPYFGGKTNDF